MGFFDKGAFKTSLLGKLKGSLVARKAKSFEDKGNYNSAIQTYLETGRIPEAIRIYNKLQNSNNIDKIKVSTQYEVLVAMRKSENEIYNIINDRINSGRKNPTTVLYGDIVIAGDKSVIRRNN